MPVKYSDEVKARAVELVLHTQAPDTSHGAITRVAKHLDLNKETLRNWGRNHKNSRAKTPVGTVDLEAENRRLRAELAESKPESTHGRGEWLVSAC